MNKKNVSRTLLLISSFLFLFFYIKIPVLASSSDTEDTPIFTDEELAFIEENPILYLGVDPDFAPYEFFDSNGDYSGITNDYLDLISDMTGFQFVILENLTWTEAYEKAVVGEVDLLPCVGKTNEREQLFLYSDPYIPFYRAIFTTEKSSISSIQDLFGKSAAIQENSSHQGFITQFPAITPHYYTTVEEALEAVSAGKETAFIGNLATTSYLIKSMGISNLQYTIEDTEDDQYLYFAVRREWPLLASILNKCLANISDEEILSINNKWMGIERSADYRGLIRILLVIGSVILFTFMISAFWIIRLKKEIKIRKKTEMELSLAKEEAERSNAFKSIFLARMSHEIRTPLNAIIGMTYLTQKTSITPTQSSYLDKLSQAAKSMLAIINDLLDFSKIEAGKIELERVSFSLDRLIVEVINLMSQKIEEKGITLQFKKDITIPEYFMGDPVRLQQILMNLLNNAVKFTDSGSVNFHVSLKETCSSVMWLIFSVKDTGIGMTKEQIEKLFVPFDQGETSITRRYGGTGLGMSIVKNLVDLMNGKIEVESIPDIGSHFSIILPLEADPWKNPSEKKLFTISKHLHSIILCKNKQDQETLTECLEAFGILCKISGDEDTFLDLIQSSDENAQSADLYIIDYTAPNQGGLGLISMLYEKRIIKSNAKIILLTPISREDILEEIRSFDHVFGLTKPLIPSILYNMIQDIFQNKDVINTIKQEVPDLVQTSYPYNILVAEDNNTNQFIIRSLLEQAGYKVTVVENGRLAVDFIKDSGSSADLILMDLHMPVMDGLTASSLIREINKEIPIVAVSADAIGDIKETCLQHGMNEFIMKPYDPAEISKKIASILSFTKENNKIETLASDHNEQVKPESNQTLNTGIGLKRVASDENLYLTILDSFIEEHNNFPLVLSQNLKNKDTERAIQTVHKLKGSAGNIGALTLYELTVQLQQSLKDSDEEKIEEFYKKIKLAFEELLKEIEEYKKKKGD